DDDIRIVTLTGEAGAAKTILSFAVGLEKKVNNFGTGKLYIARPPVSLSRKLMLGYKKGATIDKAIGSLGSYSTNLERLAELKGEKRKIDGSKMLVDLMEQCAISYLNIEDILGMSFSDDDYIIVDEAELLTKDEMKAILTRGGKQVIIGDVSQASENSGVNYDNSGLLHLIEVGKTSNLISHLTLEEIHRSEIVKEINEIW
ncbi:MAG: PhoH family protein, partial [Fusobacteriaceae bacterium]